MGRHEGAKALISERTPRQTERNKEKEARREAEEKKDVSEEKPREQQDHSGIR